MRRLRMWLRRAGDLLKKSARERDMAQEIEAHLLMHIEDNVRGGMTAGEARRQALLKFGSLEAIKEDCRDRRGVPIIDSLARDVRFAARMFRKNPLFTAVAVLSLGLGIGANTTVFSVVYGGLKGLPFRHADRIVYLSEVDRSRAAQNGPAMVSEPDLRDIQQQNHSFVDLAVFGTGTYNVSDDIAAPERVIGSRVTMNLFSLVEQKPLLGRDFLPAEDRPGAEPVAIIGYGLWQSRYAGTPGIIGRSVRVNGAIHKIIGVMPRGMRFPLLSDIWLPDTLQTSRTFGRDARAFEVFGRLRDGVSIKAADADLNAISRRLEAEYPQTNKNIDIRLKPFAEQFENERNRNATWALGAAVCFVLLIVCANLANLLLARAAHRIRETAIRIAIGATRWQVIRQLLVESMVLSCAGGILGLGLAAIGVHSLADIGEGIRLSARLPFWITISMDYHVYLYLAGVSAVTGILFGLAPALQISRTNANERLKDGAAGTGAGVRSSRLTAFLVTSEIALTLTLLVAAGLMIRSLVRFQTIDTDPNVLVGSFALPAPRYADARSQIRFLEQLLERLESAPGLAVTAATRMPTDFSFQEVHTEEASLPPVATAAVMPGYFRVLGANILKGRDFDSRDGVPESRVAIVNMQFASQIWPGDDPIGKRIRKGPRPDSPWLTVVGVSSNLQVEDSETPQEAVYTPFRQDPSVAVLIARSGLPRGAVVKTLRSEVQKADPDLPLFNVMTMAEYQAQLGVPLRLFVWFFTAFGGLAFLVSVIGIYGVTSYSVSQRSREIGIRITLGATSASLIWLVLKRSLLQLAIGLVFGLAGAFAISRALAGMLFHTAPTDGLTYTIIIFLFVVTTVAACVIPARRTTKVSPAASLRL